MHRDVVLTLPLWLAACGGPAQPAWPTPVEGLTAPADVLARAQAYTDALPFPRDRRQVRRDFLDGFFTGLVHPPRAESSRASSRPPAWTEGCRAGREHRLTQAERLDDTMAGFGFTKTAAEGEYVCGPETSVLMVRSQPPQRWWVEFMADVPLARRGGDQDREGIRTWVRATGYRSAAGRHGHLGIGDHLFLVTAMELLPPR